MTRKHYIKFAAMFKERKEALSNGTLWVQGGRYMWECLVLDTAAILREDNDRFDLTRFMEACGYDK